MRLRWSYLLLVWLAMSPAAALSQVASVAPAKPAAAKDEPETVKLVLHPAPEPRPAMKYFLYPPLLERRPGNAAVLYGKVTAEQQQFFGNKELWEKILKWVDMPLDKLPKPEMHKWLDAGSYFRFLDRAARQESADWEVPIRDEEFITILLPDLAQMRNFGRLVAAKARLQVADGDFGEALHTLQTGYAMARHVSEAPTLIHALVGMAVSNLMSKQVEALIQQPGAPNLYWALTHLPQPLVDMRPGFEAEWSMLYLSYPELRDLDKKDLSPEEWRKLLEKLVDRYAAWGLDRQLTPAGDKVATIAMAIKAYPQAKRALLQRGYTPAAVEAMPVAKVILLDTMQTYNDLRDEVFKWLAVPWPQAQGRLADADRPLHTREHQGAIPLAQVLLPAVGNAYRIQARHDRAIAALRIVEAIRLYGAAHDSRLPEKLDDITAVPIPLDPMTGKPFVYRRTGEKAVLESPGGKAYGMRYEITFARVGQVGNLPHGHPGTRNQITLAPKGK